jgi:DNA-binding CsgD family transcriptional regulator/tetratricopeptide (TPR) repeat protein
MSLSNEPAAVRPPGSWHASPAFVGRDGELAALEADLGVVAAGTLRIVLLAGEPGIGKTCLVATMLATCRSHAVVLNARAYPMGATTSLGVWIEALDRHLRTTDPAEVKVLTTGVSDELAALLPSVALAVGHRPTTEPPRIRILSSLAVLLERLAEKGPVVVHLDDAHLADGSSWEALSYLAHNLSTSPILVVVSARPAELAEHRAALEVLGSLEQEGTIARRTLTPLPPDAVAELASSVVGAPDVPVELVQWLMERTRGNPLFAVGLVGALVEEGADLSRPVLRRLPEGLTDRVEARLNGLDRTDRSVIDALAIVGYRARFDELARFCGVPPDELAGVLERLVRRRLVDEAEDGHELTYEMAHPLIAEAVYSKIGGARRRALHGRVASALVEAGRPGPAAAHFVRAAPLGDPEAVSNLIVAFGQAEKRELTREAMTILDGLLQLLPGGDPRWSDVFDVMRPQAPWIVDHRTDVDAAVGTRAMLAIEQVIAAAPDKVRLALVKFNLATFDAWGHGDLVAARRRIEEAHDLLEEVGQHQMALLAANELGYISGLEGRLDEHERRARQVLDEADAAGETFVVLQALCSLALAFLWSGQLAESFPYMERALAIARAEQYLYRVTYVLALLGFAESLAGDMSASRLRMVEAVAGNPAYRDTLLPDLRVSCNWMSGDLVDGAGWAVELSGWLTSGAVSRRRSFGAVFAAICLLELGRADQALELLGEASRPFGTSKWWLYGHLLAWANAVLHWRTAPGATSLAKLSAAADSIVAVGGSMLAPFVVADLAEAAAESHDRGLAAHAADLQLGITVPESETFSGLAAFVSAARRFAEAEFGEAASAAERAAGAFERAGWQLWWGRALAMAGRSMAEHLTARPAEPRGSGPATDGTSRQGLDRAVALLTEASHVFDMIGAVPRRDETDAVRAALGKRGKKSGRAAATGVQLTPREREVARLAAEGLSARDIAHHLFIGTRTVETHLANTYVKLGVKSRLELARRLAEPAI